MHKTEDQGLVSLQNYIMLKWADAATNGYTSFVWTLTACPYGKVLILSKSGSFQGREVLYVIVPWCIKRFKCGSNFR